jgi:hypothetical protein
MFSGKATKNDEIFTIDLTLCKGQFILKYPFGIFNSLKKRTKKFDFTTTVPQVQFFSFIFLGELKAPKRHIKIN